MLNLIIVLVAVIAAAIIARISYVCWFNSTLKQAQRAMRRGGHHEEMAELVASNWETYSEYSESRRHYRRAARLYIRLGKRSDVKFAVMKSVEMNRLYEKYLYM